MNKILLSLICLSIIPVFAAVGDTPYTIANSNRLNNSLLKANVACTTQEFRKLGKGNVFYQRESCYDGNNRKIDISLLVMRSDKVSLSNIGLPGGPQDKSLKTLTEIAGGSNIKDKIIAGINGGFFNMNTPGYSDDMCPNKTHLNYGEGDSYLFINNSDWSVNCIPRPVIAYAQQTTPMLINYLESKETLAGHSITSAGGGGPTLVINGKIAIDDNIGKYPWINNRAARTAIGFSEKEKVIYMVTIDAIRSDKSTGMTIPELANFMLENLHVENAMNLDGGGSSTMCVGKSCSEVVNKPTAGNQRIIHDGIFIIE